MEDNQGLNGTALISLHRTFHGSPSPKGDKVPLLIWAPSASHSGLVHGSSLPCLSVLPGGGAYHLLWMQCSGWVLLLSTCYYLILGTLHG